MAKKRNGNGKKNGKGKKKNSNGNNGKNTIDANIYQQPIKPEVPSKRKAPWWLLGVTAVAALSGIIVTVDYVSRGSPAENTHQTQSSQSSRPQSDISDRFSNFDFSNNSFTETVVRDSFKQMSSDDQKTLDFFVETMKDYYSKIDRLIEKKVIFTEKQGSDFCRDNFLTQFIDFVWQSNVELRDFILQRSNKGPFDPSRKYGFQGNDFLKYLFEYFSERRRYCSHQEFRHESGSVIFSFSIAEIEKITELNGNLFGNIISRQPVYYLKHPLIWLDYKERNQLRENTFPCAQNQDGKILVYPARQEEVIRRQIQNLKTFRQITDADRFVMRLMTRGLQGAGENQERFRQILRSKIRADMFHEACHTFYNKAHPEFKTLDLAQVNRSEMASMLAEIITAEDDFIYSILGNIEMLTDPYKKDARNRIFSHYASLMNLNRHLYPQIDFKIYDRTKDGSTIVYQIDKLTIPQIRSIAWTAFRNEFPELNKTQ